MSKVLARPLQHLIHFGGGICYCFPVDVVISLAVGMTSHFFLFLGYFGYYFMRLWALFFLAGSPPVEV